jgi:hypothetical protein
MPVVTLLLLLVDVKIKVILYLNIDLIPGQAIGTHLAVSFFGSRAYALSYYVCFCLSKDHLQSFQHLVIVPVGGACRVFFSEEPR